MSVAHKWSPIEDGGTIDLSLEELPPLIEVWKEQSSVLAETDAIRTFNERLNREWAIETGFIERVYAIDRGTTQILIEKGIEASLIPREGSGRDPDQIAAILQDHLDALDGMFAFIKGERDVSVGYIKELHGALLRHIDTHTVKDSSGRFFEVPLLKGVYKTLPNSPTRPDGTIHDYCPPEHVASEMDRLMEIHRKHVEAKLPMAIQAAWLHHAFTQIHPFTDGNGRVARTLASLVFVKGGAFPLVIRREDHVRYIEALEQADAGNLSPLVRLFVAAERRVCLQALQALPWPGARTDSTAPATPEEAISAIRETLVRKREVIPRPWEAATTLRANLILHAQGRINGVNQALQSELQGSPRFRTTLRGLAAAQEAAGAVREVASQLGIETTSESTEGVALELHPGPCNIVLAMLVAGKDFRGVIVGVLGFIGPDKKAVLAADDIFQLNYKDTQNSVTSRFNRWLDVGLTRALELWRERL